MMSDSKGERFRPYRRFIANMLPDAICKIPATQLSQGAKVAYSRIARFEGKDGDCTASVGTIAREIGVSERQARDYVKELRRMGLVERRGRSLVFLWHPIYEDTESNGSEDGESTRNDPAASPGTSVPPHPEQSFRSTRNNRSAKENQQENQLRESEETDLDSQARSPKPRSAPGSQEHACSESDLGELRTSLRRYMGELPSKRFLQDVMLAAGSSVSESEVVRLLESRHRAYPRGSRNGPESWSWFLTVVQSHFTEQRDRSLPPASHRSEMSADHLEMASAFDPASEVA